MKLFSFRRREPMWKKAIIAFVILGLPLLFLLSMPSVSKDTVTQNYGSIPLATVQIILYKAGIKQELTELSRVLFDNRELGSVSLVNMLRGQFLSVSLFFAILYLVLYFKERRGEMPIPQRFFGAFPRDWRREILRLFCCLESKKLYEIHREINEKKTR